MVRLAEREGADLLQPRHLRQVARSLLLGAENVDRLHRQSHMHAEECLDAAIGPGQFGDDDAASDRRHRPASVILHVPVADDAQFGDLRNEFERKLAALPIGVDDRQDLRLAEPAHRIKQFLLVGGELFLHQEIVGAARVSDILDEFEGYGIRHVFLPAYIVKLHETRLPQYLAEGRGRDGIPVFAASSSGSRARRGASATPAGKARGGGPRPRFLD